MLATADFLGRWTFTREISDHLRGEEARAEGKALIVAEEGRWIYEEQANLTLASGQSLTATRRYLWQPAGAGFDLFFEDERPFHRIDLGRSHAASHWCAPDSYDVTYDFAAFPEWESLWQVEGPRKRYAMRTRYAPAR